MTEQLYGGALDGLELETFHYPDFIALPCGARYYRRRDGKLYQDGCRWDDDNTRKVTS